MACRLEGAVSVLGPGRATVILGFWKPGSLEVLGHWKGSAMSAAGTTTSTIRLHRVLRAPAQRIYRAFLDADAMAKWLPPNGFTGKVHQLDAKVGGTHKMSFTNFTTGQSHSFG